MKVMKSGELQRDVGSWQLKNTNDSYGNHLETELGQLCRNIGEIELFTKDLPLGFVADGYYGELGLSGYPGEIEDITDFSKIICFGYSSDGAPFCFDYRESGEPKVIWWDDIYWRVVSLNFKSFIALFEVSS